MSWPQACITPSFCDFHSKSFRSVTGRASMSARSTAARRSPSRGLAAFDAGHDARRRDPAVFDAQFVELLFDKCRRVVFPEREFGMRMQAAAEFDRIHNRSLF